MSSQVVTLYEDEAKTNAIYPRTKLSAISDDDSIALGNTISELNNNILKLVYPVGSVYFSVNNTNPNTTFGFGTWELIGSKLAIRENVFGNGYAEGLTDGTNLGVRRSKAYYDEIGYPGGVGRLLGSVSGAGNFSSYTVGGLPTKAQLGNNPQYSGLIVDTETIYSWKRTA